ncbi:MAG: glycosyl transferase family 2, partial [Bacteroidetes bacterium SW_10_40_5]
MFQVQHLSVHFGGEPIFDDVTFLINKTDKIGLVGRNGAGKSTLMRVLAGTQTYEKGSVTVPKEATVGYLPQEFQGETHRTVLDETRMAF